jgi:hypothetical protein
MNSLSGLDPCADQMYIMDFKRCMTSDNTGRMDYPHLHAVAFILGDLSHLPP